MSDIQKQDPFLGAKQAGLTLEEFKNFCEALRKMALSKE